MTGKPNEIGLYRRCHKARLNGLNQKVVNETKYNTLWRITWVLELRLKIAQNKNYAGIILESPYTSMVNLGKKYYPFFPVRFLLKDKFESYKKITNISAPVLIIHGKVDKIVPFAMGKKMYELANEPKFFYSQEYGDHMVDYDEKLLLVFKKIYSTA